MVANQQVNVGLLGFGRIAQLKHLPALQKVANVVAVAEADLERRAVLPSSVALYTDYRALLADADVEAVVICLPTHLHTAAAVAAFAHGKHVYVEKPLAATVADGERIVSAWRAAGTVGMVGFNFRFFPQYAEAKRRIASGEIGDVMLARAVFTSRMRSLPAWKQARETGGGVLLDLASHHVDLACFLFETEVAHVTGTTSTRHHFQDSATLTLTLANDVTVQISVALADRERQQFEIVGTEGSLLIDRFAPTINAQPPRFSLRRFKPDYSQPFDDALATFVNSIQTGTQTAPTIADGMASLRVVLSADPDLPASEKVGSLAG